MKFCTKCGMGLDDNATSCFNCGTPLVEEKADVQPQLFGATDVPQPQMSYTQTSNQVKFEEAPKEKKGFPIWIPIVAALAVIVLVVGVVLMTSGGKDDNKGDNGDYVADNGGNTDDQNGNNGGNDNTGDNAGNAGGTDDNNSNQDKYLPSYFDGPDVPDEIREYVFYNDYRGDEVVELGTPATALDPQKVYDTVKYIPEMFYGEYVMENVESKLDDYDKYINKIMGKDLGYSRVAYDDYIPILPSSISAGPHTLWASRYTETNLYWMEFGYHYRRESDGKWIENYIPGYYEIDGKTLKFTPTSFEYSYDSDSYTMHPGETIEYEFEFNGTYLTLTKDGQSVTLLADGFHTDGGYNDGILTEAYLKYDSKISYGRIFYFDMCNGYDVYGKSLRICDLNGYVDHNAKIKMTTDGLFTMTWTNSQGVTNTAQLVYFSCGKDGLVLTDGTNTVCYTYNQRDYTDMYIEDNIGAEDSEKLENMEEEEMEAIIEKKANLLKDLAAAYEAAGMNVQINEVTGEIALDSTVLFGVDQSTISSEGKTFLSKFIDIYCDVVFDPKYEDFISKIIVEGHTDTTGTYERNQTLSQERADSVKSYCLSAVNSTYVNELTDMMISAGYAYTKPIYDENGDVDMDASRRVAFRFLISLE